MKRHQQHTSLRHPIKSHNHHHQKRRCAIWWSTTSTRQDCATSDKAPPELNKTLCHPMKSHQHYRKVRHLMKRQQNQTTLCAIRRRTTSTTERCAIWWSVTTTRKDGTPPDEESPAPQKVASFDEAPQTPDKMVHHLIKPSAVPLPSKACISCTCSLERGKLDSEFYRHQEGRVCKGLLNLQLSVHWNGWACTAVVYVELHKRVRYSAHLTLSNTGPWKILTATVCVRSVEGIGLHAVCLSLKLLCTS